MSTPPPDDPARAPAVPSAWGSAGAPVPADRAEDVALFRAAFEHSLDAMLVADEDGRYLAVNQAAAEMLGYPRERLLTMSVADLRVPEGSPPAGEQYATHLHRGRTRGEFEFVRPDGAVRVGAFAATAIGGGRHLAILRDVTEAKRHEAELHDLLARLDTASRAKDQFLAVLSHELRTPLTPILTLAQLVERAPDLPPAVRHAAATISRNVQLEAKLIDDLLDLTRITRGKMELQLVPVDAEDQLRQVVEMCAQEAHAKGLAVEVACGAAQRVIHADAARLQQVFWNVYRNAVKFTPAGGRIWVRTRNTVRGVFEAEITDTGIGILAGDLPRLFDPFEQGSRERTRRFGGLGLGLSISRMLVDLHGGRLVAESPGPDLGATFTITLPALDDVPAAGAGDRAHEAGPAPPRRRILVVDDHDDTLHTMEMLLRLKGYDVVGASSVEAALRAAGDAVPFDAVVSDIGLPDGTGLDLLRRLRERRPLPGIALSGFGTQEDKDRCRDAGFSDHLTKPVDVDQLADALARLLPR